MAVTMARLAAQAPVPVFVARGGGSGLAPLAVAADPRVRLVASPRHATVLLAAGRFPGAMGVALDRVHDQLCVPGRTVWWTADPEGEHPAALSQAQVVTGADPVDAVLAASAQALAGPARSVTVRADEPPAPFEGRGDHGQGGEGMMGGTPYGRPMAMTGDDRDGLALDRLPVVLGPFLVGLPNGMQIVATVQGSVVQEARVEFLDLGSGPALPDHDGMDGGLRHDLLWLAEALRLGGLDALAVRSARLASTGAQPEATAALARMVRRSGLPLAWSGIGTHSGSDARRRLERRLEFDPGDPGDDGTTAVSGDDLAGVLAGSDWADALVAVWSLEPRAGVRTPAAGAGS